MELVVVLHEEFAVTFFPRTRKDGENAPSKELQK